MKKILLKIFLILLLKDNFCLTKISLKNNRKSLITLCTTVLYALINSIFNKINIDKQNSIWKNETEKKIEIKAFFLKLEDELFEFIEKYLKERENKTGKNVLDISLGNDYEYEKVFKKEGYFSVENINDMAKNPEKDEDFKSEYYSGTPRGFFWITNSNFNSRNYYNYLMEKNLSVKEYKFNFLEMIKSLKEINLEEFIKNEENKKKRRKRFRS